MSDYCKYPNQCGPGMDCSSCMSDEIDRLRQRLADGQEAAGEVVVTKDEAGQIVAVTRQDDEGRILSFITESAPQAAQGATVPMDKLREMAGYLVHMGREGYRLEGGDVDRIAAEYGLSASPAAEQECIWTFDDDGGCWDTGCGQKFFFTTMNSPTENGMQYCYSCGKRLREGGGQ